MIMNSRLMPNTDHLTRAGYKLPELVSLPVKEVYKGTYRIADSKSITVISSPMQRHNQHELTDMDLYNRLFGDRLVVVEGSIEGWRKTGETPQTITTTVEVEDIGVIVDLTQHSVENGRKWVSNLQYHGPIGRLGINLSKAETLRQAYLNLKETLEYQRFVKFLKSRGYKEPEELEQIAVGFLADNEAAAVTSDGKILFVNQNYAKLIEAWAKEYGVDPEEFHLYILHHEIGHRWGAKGTAKGERELESLIAQFFEKLASKEAMGPVMETRSAANSQRDRYLRIARNIAGRRYDNVSKNYGSLSSLFQCYFKEALEDGLKEEESFDYALEKVAEKVEEMEDEAGEESEDEGTEEDEEKSECKEGSEEDSESEEGSEESEESEEPEEGEEPDADDSESAEE